MDNDQPNPKTHLTWANVAFGSSFILIDAIISFSSDLGVGRALVTAALRCALQLAAVGLVLQKVFEAQNFWAVAGIACE